MMHWDAVIEFPVMKVGVRTRDERVVEIRYLPLSSSNIAPESSLAERAVRQLERYRDDPDAVFDLPLLVEGSPLQRGVWQAMCAIPRGETRTYGAIAQQLGDTDYKTLRAIGQACGDNRLPIVIPCHRVVAANGLGGFAHSTDGFLIEAKRWLLLHESGEFELRP
jgi:methylated-DNA-[protein]-cysteine S-methyltransferase